MQLASPLTFLAAGWSVTDIGPRIIELIMAQTAQFMQAAL
jgi:hypothetical protein